PKGMSLFRWLLRKTPAIADALATRHHMYNRELDYISEQERLGNTLIIYPEKELPIGRIEQDEAKMRNVYQMGRDTAKTKMTEIKKFLGI
ncbi:MAG: patatin family protein, partial [Paludibacteraceae bacterium]|nr:patatin family protein [Paludibacteraceae bacterium]